MALVDSLLTAMVRANGDALVMHVGEKPIVVAGSKTIDLSSHGLNLSAMVGMLGQLLPSEAQAALREFGAVEHTLPAHGSHHFSVVAARGGDDIWIEIRRRRESPNGQVAHGDAEIDADQEASSGIEPTPPAEADDSRATSEPEVPTSDEAAPHVAPTAAEEAPPDQRMARVAVGTVVVEVSADEPAPAEIDAPAEIAAPAEAAALSDTSAPTDVAGPTDAVDVPEDSTVTSPESDDGAPSPDIATGSDFADGADEAAAAESVDHPLSRHEPEPIVAGPAVQSQDDAAAADGKVHGTDAASAAADEIGQAVEREAEPGTTAGAVEAHGDEHATEADEPTAPAAEAPASQESMPADAEAATRSSDLEPPAAAAQAEPAMASIRTHQSHTSELTTPMSSNEAAPNSGPPTGGPSVPFTPAPDAAAGTGDVPLTRTVRIEVPSRTNAGRTVRIEHLLKAATTHDVTELFLVSQSRPYVRVAGDIRLLADESPLQPTDVETLLADLTPEPWREAVRRGDPAEWLIELAGVGRVRCSSFRDHRGPGAIFRFAGSQVASAEQMGLDEDAILLATEPEGLVIVAGPVAADRSAVVATFVDTINQRRSDYIITVQRLVRTLHENRHALISQREVGADPTRMAPAVSAAIRENPDVLVIEDVASADVAALALEASRDERLVIVSLEAPSTAAAVQRLVGLLPADQQPAARATMSRVFRGAIAHLLVRKAAGGRIAARELLVSTRPIAALIADSARSDLAAALEVGRDERMTPIADVLASYVKDGTVDVREAFRKAPDTSQLLAALRAVGVSTSTIERLA